MRAWIDVFRSAGLRFSADGSAFLAQAVAFNALFAAVPLSLLVTALFGFFFGDRGARDVVLALEQYTPEQFHALLATNAKAVVQYRGISGIIALGGLAWSGKNIFQAVAYALNRTLGLEGRHVVWDVLVALVLIPAAGIVIILATVLPVVISVVVRVTRLDFLAAIPEAFTYLASLGLVFVVCAAIYTYLPNRRAEWWFGIPGAAVTAIGYSILQVAFAVYATHTNAFQVYGALSAVFAALLWLYLIGVIFLFGAQVSAAWERRTTEAERAA